MRDGPSLPDEECYSGARFVERPVHVAAGFDQRPPVQVLRARVDGGVEFGPAGLVDQVGERQPAAVVRQHGVHLELATTQRHQVGADQRERLAGGERLGNPCGGDGRVRDVAESQTATSLT